MDDTAGWQLRCFFVALAVFHSTEFALAAAYHRSAGLSSLLLTAPYMAALAAGLAEHSLERWLVPGSKASKTVTRVGLGLVVLGEIIRKLAILTARRNFTHDIRVFHEDGHELVTRGVYKWVRHPSYLGFFIFAVGTQVLLCNPVTTVAYVVVLWRFFSDRIEYEEYFLYEFFGREYEEYARRTPSGLPFVE